MPDKKESLERVSPLANYPSEHIVDYASVRLSERRALTAIQVLSFKGRHADVAQAIGKALKVECPVTPGVSNSDGKIQVSWNGPNSWMIVCSDAEAGFKPGALLQKLRKAAGDAAAVVDQSHGRCGLRLSGARARDGMRQLVLPSPGE